MVNGFCSISPQLLVKEGAMRSAAGSRNSVAGMRWGRISSAVVAGTVLVMGAAASSWAQGQTYTEMVIYSFASGSDGADPLAGLVRDGAGNLYGTTASGGASGLGAVFKVSAGGAETVLHSFTGTSDGEYSEAGLVQDGVGNLYGTTDAGGASGFGTVFKIDAKGNETVLYSFRGGPTVNTPPSVWCGTQRTTFTAPPTPAALPATESFSRSAQQARRPCCIASKGARTGNTLTPA
jgi:uncharacterized repeat protein (TIGR03803 family)